MLEFSTDFYQNFTFGNSYDFGNFQECIKILHKSPQIGRVEGQHCMIQFYSGKNHTVTQGPVSSFYNFGWKNLHRSFGAAICLPASCSPQKTRNFVRKKLAGTDLIIADDYDQSDYCKTGKQREKAKFLWIATTVVFSALLLLSIIQTSYDIIKQKIHKEKPKKKFISFSLYTNTLNLVSLQQPDGAIKCLDGAKVLSTLAIIVFHTSYHRKFFPLTDSRMFNDYEKTFLSFLTFGCHFLVEAFFVISGLLVSRSILKELKT